MAIKTIIGIPCSNILANVYLYIGTSPFSSMGIQTLHEDYFNYKYKLSQNKYMYRLKIAGKDQVSFLPVPFLMVVKIIWSTVVSGLFWSFLKEYFHKGILGVITGI